MIHVLSSRNHESRGALHYSDACSDLHNPSNVPNIVEPVRLRGYQSSFCLHELTGFGSVCISAVASTVCNAQSSRPEPPL